MPLPRLRPPLEFSPSPKLNLGGGMPRGRQVYGIQFCKHTIFLVFKKKPCAKRIRFFLFFQNSYFHFCTFFATLSLQNDLTCLLFNIFTFLVHQTIHYLATLSFLLFEQIWDMQSYLFDHDHVVLFFLTFSNFGRLYWKIC